MELLEITNAFMMSHHQSVLFKSLLNIKYLVSIAKRWKTSKDVFRNNMLGFN